MSKTLTLFDKLRIFAKLKGVNDAMKTKDSTKIIVAIIGLVTLIAETGWAQEFIKNAVLAHPGIAVLLVGLVKVILTLHVPDTDQTKQLSDSISKATGTSIAILCVIGLLALAPVAYAQDAPLPTNIYAAGLAYNPNASPGIAGTGLYARKVADSGTYAFTLVDALPSGRKPFTVNSNFGVGVAQKLVTIGKFPIFVPTSASLSSNGINVGWAWSTGALTSIKLKDNWRVMPNIRLVKSSVSNGSGYQPIIGVMFGFVN